MPRLLICILAFLLAALPGFAAILDVEAENVQKKGDRVEAFGNVIVSGQDIKLTANYVVYDTATEDIWAVGGVQLNEKSGELKAEAMYYNTKRRDFHLQNGSVFVYAQPVIIAGESITRYGMDEYEGDNVEITPCLGAPPAWSLAANRLQAPLERYGQGKHVRFQVRELPVLYFPYLLFPVKIQRQSGVLLPQISNATDYGQRIGLPYYRVLSRSTDATITPNYLSDRGLLMAGEFRYRLDADQYGEIYGESLLNDEKAGEDLTGNILDEVPDSRWLLRSFQRGGKLTWDVKLVSTPDYFRDIGPMYRNENVFRDTQIGGESRSDEELVSRGQWREKTKSFSANLSGLWKQDLTLPSNEKTLQQLPRLTLRMNQQAIPGTPAFVSSTVTSENVYSVDWIREIRNVGQVETSLPLSYFPYVTVTPSYTQYYRNVHITDNPGTFENDATKARFESGDSTLTSSYSYEFFQDNPGIFDKDTYQELWGRRDLQITSALYSRRFLDGMYHQVVPSVSWTYFSKADGNYDPSDVDDVFPSFLSEDEWERVFTMTVGIDNYIRDRTGLARAQFSLSRIYDYLIDEWDYYEANIVLKPSSWLSLRHLNRFGQDPHPYATIEHWTRLTLNDPRGDELYLTEEYSKDETKKMLLGVKAKLTKAFSARYEVEYDFLNDRYIDNKQGVSYSSQCWSVEVFREVDTSEESLPRDTTVGVTVNLLGLGQVVRTERTVSGSGEL